MEPIASSASAQARCEKPRTGIDPITLAAYPDQLGTVIDEKNWVRSWIDETYLWYSEVPTDLLASSYPTPVAYFDVLKTPQLTGSGRPKDRFHFSASTEAVNANSAGLEIGYGMTLGFTTILDSLDVRVAFVEPASPAAQASVVRGDRLLEVNDVVVNLSNIGILDSVLGPAENAALTLRLRAIDGSERTVTMTSAEIERDPVPYRDLWVYTRGSRTIGYLVFNEHSAPAEYGLYRAMTLLKPFGLTDLVVDMRYNGGGAVDVASQLAYMATSEAQTKDKVFTRLLSNQKPFIEKEIKIPFHSTGLGMSVVEGTSLPQLGLSSVTVLTGPDTCSASEAVVNGLRGIGVTVNVVGGTTCGKPYAFYPKDNCGTTYFAVQLQGVNERGWGDFGDGFAPTCAVPDDFTHDLGDPDEARLSAAIHLIRTGLCPSLTLSKGDTAVRAKAEAARTPYLVRPPMREIQWLRTPPKR